MKIGFACGVFDLYHPGHVRMLRDCKERCDYLVVALNSAKNLHKADISKHKNPPILNIEERVEVISSIKFVDEVLVYNSEEELMEIMSQPRMKIRFLGDDYKGKPITGADLPLEIIWIDRGHGYSTSGLIRRVMEVHGARTTQPPH